MSRDGKIVYANIDADMFMCMHIAHESSRAGSFSHRSCFLARPKAAVREEFSAGARDRQIAKVAIASVSGARLSTASRIRSQPRIDRAFNSLGPCLRDCVRVRDCVRAAQAPLPTRASACSAAAGSASSSRCAGPRSFERMLSLDGCDEQQRSLVSKMAIGSGRPEPSMKVPTPRPPTRIMSITA
eukprot:6188432-Pleurochrysis_carterae.AAC.1